MARRPALGQHFLRDRPALRRIARLAAAPGDTVIEVGPGRGALTRQLLRIASRVIAVELDRELAAELPARCGRSGRLRILREDILGCDLASLTSGLLKNQSVIAGNLPYYITSPVLRAAFSARHLFRSATFLMQEEVADRVVAAPQSRSYGFLSCLSQLHSRPAKRFSLAPRAFSPPPRVRSAVVTLDFSAPDPPEGFERFLSACFRQPRKTLKNNLLPHYRRSLLDDDPRSGLRAQQLATDDLMAMWVRLERAGRRDDGQVAARSATGR